MLPKVYFDEAGNTGSNITNSEQPYFVLSSVCFTDDELDKIREDVAFDDELHFVRIKSRWDGRAAIRKLLQHPLFDENHVTYQVVDKTFAIYAFMVDILVEPYFKYVLHQDLYKGRNNIILANCLYAFAESSNYDSVVKGFVQDLKRDFEKKMRTQTRESIEQFYETVYILQSLTDEGFNDILEMMSPSQDMLDVVLTEDKKYFMDITASSLMVLTEHWHKRFGTRIDVFSDESKPLSEKKSLIEKMMAIDGNHKVGYDTRKTTFPLQINSLNFVDSATNYGVQIADLVASIVAFSFTGTKGLEDFQKEMKESTLLHFHCYPLMPSSTADLEKAVDTSNDSDPLDFIAEKLWEG